MQHNGYYVVEDRQGNETSEDHSNRIIPVREKVSDVEDPIEECDGGEKEDDESAIGDKFTPLEDERRSDLHWLFSKIIPHNEVYNIWVNTYKAIKLGSRKSKNENDEYNEITQEDDNHAIVERVSWKRKAVSLGIKVQENLYSITIKYSKSTSWYERGILQVMSNNESKKRKFTNPIRVVLYGLFLPFLQNIL